MSEDETDGEGGYEGELKDGVPHGQGTETFGNWDKYVGGIENNKFHGQGTFTWVSGNKYVGEWADGKQHGQGVLTTAAGGKYVGEWVDGKQHGQGVLTTAAGDKYVGEWADGKRHGQGTGTWVNGNKYVGEWVNGEQQGQGTYTTADGDKYVGEFENDERHGQGTYTTADGDKYVGEWWEGRKGSEDDPEDWEEEALFVVYDYEIFYLANDVRLPTLKWSWEDLDIVISEHTSDNAKINVESDVSFELDLNHCVDWSHILNQLPGLLHSHIAPKDHPIAGSGYAYWLDENISAETLNARIGAVIQLIESHFPSILSGINDT